MSLTVVAFAPVARNAFINLDDSNYIHENSRVHPGLTWETARWALTSTEDGNWIPLRRLADLSAVSLFGMWPGGHHLMSLAFHVAAALLLFAALRLMTGALWCSLVVPTRFSVDPLQVESVACCRIASALGALSGRIGAKAQALAGAADGTPSDD